MAKSPTQGPLTEAEVDPKRAEMKRRARIERAKTVIGQRMVDGEILPGDYHQARKQFAKLVRQFEKEDAAAEAAGAAEMGRLASVPETDPEAVYGVGDTPKVAPIPQKDIDAQKFALATSKSHAAREREKELADVQNAETPDLPGSGAEHRADAPRKPGEDILDFSRSQISRPGWNTKIKAYVDKETGKINPRYFLWKPQGARDFELMKPDQQAKLEKILMHPVHGRLLSMMHLKSNPEYVVQLFKGESGPIAVGLKMTRGQRPEKIAMGDLQKVQSTVEDAAGFGGEKEEPFHFGATTQKPGAEVGAAPGHVPPPGGWQDFDLEQVNDVSFDENSNEPIRWGDFWVSKSPEEIAALPINPADIDPVMAKDPRLSQQQADALRVKIHIPRKGEPERKHYMPRPDLTGQKTVTVTDPKTGKKYKEKVTDWETPAIPGGGALPPKLVQKRAEIKAVAPKLKDVIDKFGKDAKIKLKRTDDVEGWRVSYDREGKGTDVDLKTMSPDEADPNEKCGHCGHPSSEHAAGVYSCQNPACQVEKEFKSGKMKVSTCQHFVGKGKKAGKGKRIEQTWDADAAKSFIDELGDLPSNWGSESAGEDNKRITDVVGALDTYLDAVRKSAWGKLRQEKVQEFASAIFGKETANSSDPKVASVARNLADQVVFGARGAGPDWDENKRLPWATSRSTPGNWHRQAEEIRQIKGARKEPLTMWDQAIMRLASFPEKGPGSIYKLADTMRANYDQASEALKNEMAENESAIVFIKQLARDLRAASTKGKGADTAMGLEKVGSKVRWEQPTLRKKKGGKETRLAQPMGPTVHRAAPEEVGADEAEVEAAKAASRAERFKGAPKFRGEERPAPEVIRTNLPGASSIPGQVFDPEGRPISTPAYRREEEMMADDPASRHRREEDEWISNLKPSVRPKLRQEQKQFDSWLNNMLEHAQANHSPSWWDDLE